MADTTRLLGPDGRPIRRQELVREIAAPSVTGVRQIISGHPSHGLTPVRLGQLLRSAEQGDPTSYLELAEDMEEKDLHYAGVLGVRKRAVRGMKIRVEPAGKSAKEQEAARLAEEVLAGDGVRDDLVDVLDSIGKGYSVTEIVWATDGPRHWTVDRMEWRDPRWFRPSRDDGRTMFLLDEGGQEVPLAPWRFVTHFARAKSGLPVRSGLARLAAWAYIFKNFALKDWAIFVETYGHPIRLGRYGPEALPADITQLLRALRSIGADMAAAIPKSMELELVHSEGARANAELYERKVRYWDEQVSKGVLGQVATTDAIAGGHAVGKIHNDVRDDIRDADAEQLATTLRRDLVAPLTAFNFGPDVGVPRVRFESPDEVPLDTLTSALKELVPLGLRVGEAEIRARLGLRTPDDREAVLGAPAAVERPLTAARASGGDPPSDQPRQRPAPLDDAIERTADDMLDDWEPMLAPIVAGLEDELAAAASVEEARAVLRRRLRTMDVDELTEQLARATFAARIAGETEEPITE